MESGYAPIWTECKNLAETEDFQDLQARYTRKLYDSTSLTYRVAPLASPLPTILFSILHTHF